MPTSKQHKALPHFTPVPLAVTRRNGWTPDRQRAFIAALARTGVVRFAAAAVGMSARSAYQLRDRVAWDHPFAFAWDKAIDQARAAAAAIAERGLRELEIVPVIHRGRIIGTRTRLNTKLAVAALRQMLREDQFEGEIPSHFEQRWAQIRRRDMAGSRAREAAPPPAPKPAPQPPPPPAEACAPPPLATAPRERPTPRVRWL